MSFKILISPTPIIGPDDHILYAQSIRKIDNHTNEGGYRSELDKFLDWAKSHDLQKTMFILTGDRHWQYHSINPDGFEEFGSGSISDLSAREPARSGDPLTTDPDGLIDQTFTAESPTGGFLLVHVRPGQVGTPDQLDFTWMNESGETIHSVTRYSL